MSPERQTDFYEAEAPQASRELAELRTSRDYAPPFEIVRRRVIDDLFDGKATIDATVVIRIGTVEKPKPPAASAWFTRSMSRCARRC